MIWNTQKPYLDNLYFSNKPPLKVSIPVKGVDPVTLYSKRLLSSLASSTLASSKAQPSYPSNVVFTWLLLLIILTFLFSSSSGVRRDSFQSHYTWTRRAFSIFSSTGKSKYTRPKTCFPFSHSTSPSPVTWRSASFRDVACSLPCCVAESGPSVAVIVPVVCTNNSRYIYIFFSLILFWQLVKFPHVALKPTKNITKKLTHVHNTDYCLQLLPFLMFP